MSLVALAGCGPEREFDAPDVTVVAPLPGARYVGVGTIEIAALVTDTSRTTVELVVGGEVVDEVRLGGSCHRGCDVTLVWDNRALAQGEHAVTVRATDHWGNVGRAETNIALEDVLYVSRIEVTGMGDRLLRPNLEVEAHLYDADTGGWMSCTGADQGMGPVDASDLTYEVTALFVPISPDSPWLTFDEVRGLNLEVVVTENDDHAPCPSPTSAFLSRPLVNDDDLFGRSGGVPADSMEMGTTLSFGGVPSMNMMTGRPL